MPEISVLIPDRLLPIAMLSIPNLVTLKSLFRVF